mmetsp:Transcript_101666/g.313717  ORF Transcript_101666/g.313717 Transcript_101666/m.313717 type:complete len:222 (+) Transcript_101666:973-1638(+)
MASVEQRCSHGLRSRHPTMPELTGTPARSSPLLPNFRVESWRPCPGRVCCPSSRWGSETAFFAVSAQRTSAHPRLPRRLDSARRSAAAVSAAASRRAWPAALGKASTAASGPHRPCLELRAPLPASLPTRTARPACPRWRRPEQSRRSAPSAPRTGARPAMAAPCRPPPRTSTSSSRWPGSAARGTRRRAGGARRTCGRSARALEACPAGSSGGNSCSAAA